MGLLLNFFWYGTLLAGGGWLSLRVLEHYDIYKVFHSNVPGPCQYVKGVERGSEDIAVLPTGIAILSTGGTFVRRSGQTTATEGALMSFNLNTPDTAAKVLKLSGFKGYLNPHGLSLFTEGGKTYVYVVNHPPFSEPPPADTVVKFLWDIEKENLIHQKTFSSPEFRGLNNLVVVGLDKFYTTNYLMMTSPILRMIEILFFFLPLQNVVYFDGKVASVVLSGLYGANGIDISPDRKYLYVAEVPAKRVSSYRIEAPTKLVHVDSKPLGTSADNLNVDPETGDIWTGTHPRGLELMKYLLGYTNKSPSQVLRIGVKDGHFTKVAEIYSDDGSVLTASTVAVPYKGNVFIGTVDHKALFCKTTGLNAILNLK